MNAGFWFTVGVLTGATATAASVPLWRHLAAMLTGPRRLYALAAAGLAVFALSAALLYMAIDSRATSGTPLAAAPGHPVGTAGAPGTKALSMQDATTQLEARLEKDGGSTEDWELLAKSYEFLGRTADAQRARQHRASATNVSPAEISGTVSIEDRLASHIDQGATLFIYAKAADSPGPPLAVLRLSAGNWPVTFRLDDSMAMLPSRRLSQFQKVIVEARISRSGQATPATGDLYVTSDTVSPSSGKKLALVIDHQIG
jgi:hypothetical protein